MEPVELHVDVFRAGMVNWVMSQGTGRLVVNEKSSRGCGIQEVEFLKQSTKPDDVLCCIVSSDVLGLHGRSGDNLLSTRHPGH
jgi:hypothetical protein